MNQVFAEARIGSILLRNRIIRSSTHEGLADECGRPTETLIRRYTALAEDEVGAIITGCAWVQRSGKASLHNTLMIESDEHLGSYQRAVDAVHRSGTSLILQIAHCGRQTRSKITGLPVVAPSPIRDGLFNEDLPRQMSEDEIHDTIHRFVDAIERARATGFDGVQLNLAHGYLLSSFLSPHMNKRTDCWGGSQENRFRIVAEIMRLARERVGSCPILAKINAYEKSPDGLRIAESVKIAEGLERSGCDAIEVSCGIAEEGFVTFRGDIPFDMVLTHNHRMRTYPRFLRPLLKPALQLTMSSPKPRHLYNLDSAEEIRRHVSIPVIVVGGIRRLDDIRNIIEQDRCDFVSMSRPFIIEPDIVRKFREGKQRESKCLDCNCCTIGAEVRPLRCYYGRAV